jgi:hypothetical protein
MENSVVRRLRVLRGLVALQMAGRKSLLGSNCKQSYSDGSGSLGQDDEAMAYCRLPAPIGQTRSLLMRYPAYMQ